MDPNQEMAELQKQWQAPRELRRAIPREVRLAKGGIAVAVLAVLFLFGALAGGVLLGEKARRQGAERRDLDAHGVPAEAVVTRLWHGSDKEQAPMVAYEFPYSGRIFRHSTRAPQKVWKNLSEGSKVAIRFLPDHPENNTPLDWKGDGPMPVFVPFLVAAMGGFGSFAMFWMLRFQRRLLSEGKAAMGIVRKSRRSSHGKKVITYEYVLPGGRVIKRTSGPTHQVRAPGTVVTVVYDPEKPTRSALYPLDLVRVDEMS
jgi:hypothetical protein